MTCGKRASRSISNDAVSLIERTQGAAGEAMLQGIDCKEPVVRKVDAAKLNPRTFVNCNDSLNYHSIASM
jgi:hypothetical protein